MMQPGELDLKGQECLNAGDLKQAISCFQKALKQEEHPSIRNNLALAHFLAGDPQFSLEILSLNLEPDAPPNPFAHSIAVQCFHQMGQDHEARHQLDLAIKDFEDGIHAFPDRHSIPISWGEYTVAILRAAGALNDHHQVYDLYLRWKSYHQHWESTYFAGVAAFNLKRYRQAASCWGSLFREGRIFPGIQRLAIMMDQGNIPPFTLDYKFIDQQRIMNMATEAISSNDPERFRQMADSSMVRLFCLSFILDEEASLDVRSQFTQLLVQYGGEWGEQLGRTWLLSPIIEQDLKMSIIIGMEKAGVYQAGEPIQMYADGEVRTVTYEQFAASESIVEELEPLYDQALTLIQTGKQQEAMQLLEKPLEAGKIYPPAMLLLAQLYHGFGFKERKEKLLFMLHDIAKRTGDDNLSLNLARFYLNIGDIHMARQQLAQIDLKKIPQELRQQMQDRLSQLEVDNLFEHEFDHFTDDMRKKIEDKSLPLHAGLQQGLKNMPVQWINAACETYDLKPARLRPEREKQLIQYLQQRENLQELLQELEDDEREVLDYLLKREGWSLIGPITRKFGSMEGDGYYWNEDGPYSALGQLWSLGLVFIGRCTIDNRRSKIVTIPIELRPLLTDILQKKNARDGSFRSANRIQ